MSDVSACPKCQHVHVAGDVIAVDRFEGGAITAYCTPDGYVWLTREVAQQWLCGQRQRAAS